MGLLTKLWGKKQEVPQPSEPPSESSIQDWLVTRIAAIAQVGPQEIALDRPFAEFGMDSMQLFELSGDLQKFLGHEVSEIIAWDYPTIAKLSQFLSLPESRVSDSATLAPEDDLASLALTPGATEPQR